MITVNMTEMEYKAYLLYLKSIEIMREAKKGASGRESAESYLSDPENIKELEGGLDDLKAGRITYIDPKNIWENIK